MIMMCSVFFSCIPFQDGILDWGGRFELSDILQFAKRAMEQLGVFRVQMIYDSGF